ncbi:hypothetical protein GYMLUDRAFT_44470 [Collybiopsis luxurians FD-317 M1]|uniref:Uncharacterized protein n=1 Tax=Collybiopsis luxurians FD-317 M1 TaxID=944289 RepID=A0A0D0B7R8_9AGAR|nr:hypothetical protein GYMLUDRAFT_44470 [Collybiopsis luxurians FD-317 M1]
MTAEEHKFPNEVFSLIINYLQNTALVCKESAAMSQSRLFHVLCLSSTYHDQGVSYLVHQFASLLDASKTNFIGRLVEKA